MGVDKGKHRRLKIASVQTQKSPGWTSSDILRDILELVM